MILSGLFVANVGVAKVRLPVLLIKAPPEPVVNVIVPDKIVERAAVLLPILDVPAVGTARIILPFPALSVP